MIKITELKSRYRVYNSDPFYPLCEYKLQFKWIIL